jgi:hypothetical protein
LLKYIKTQSRISDRLGAILYALLAAGSTQSHKKDKGIYQKVDIENPYLPLCIILCLITDIDLSSFSEIKSVVGARLAGY